MAVNDARAVRSSVEIVSRRARRRSSRPLASIGGGVSTDAARMRSADVPPRARCGQNPALNGTPATERRPRPFSPLPYKAPQARSRLPCADAAESPTATCCISSSPLKAWRSSSRSRPPPGRSLTMFRLSSRRKRRDHVHPDDPGVSAGTHDLVIRDLHSSSHQGRLRCPDLVLPAL